MKLVLSFLFLFLLIAEKSHAQAEVFWEDSLKHYERKIVRLGDSLLESSSQFKRQMAAKDLIQVMRKTLSLPGAYNYGFDSLRFMSKLRPEDDAFRLFTWVLRLDGNRFRYFGVIHMNNPDEFVYHPLFDRSEDYKPQVKTQEEKMEEPAMLDSVYDNEQWEGMHYYDIDLVEKKKWLGLVKEPYYTLVGWDGHNNLSHKKVIDILTFNKDGTPIFGAPIIDKEGDTYNRIILEYNARAVVTLKCHENDPIISFDELVPPAKKNEGDFFTYIPSGKYNYLLWKKNRWIFKEDLFNTYNDPVDEAQ